MQNGHICLLFKYDVARLDPSLAQAFRTCKPLPISELHMARHGSRHRWSGQKWDFLRSYSIPVREKALGVAKRTPAGRWIGCNCFHL
jgi:hypothetical protein